jgi:hypothetical protein
VLLGWKFREFSLERKPLPPASTSTIKYLLARAGWGAKHVKLGARQHDFRLGERQNKNAWNVRLVIESTALDKFSSLLIEAPHREAEFLLLSSLAPFLWSLSSSLAYGCAKNSLSACQSTFPSYLQLDNGRRGIINLIIKIFSQEIEVTMWEHCHVWPRVSLLLTGNSFIERATFPSTFASVFRAYSSPPAGRLIRL